MKKTLLMAAMLTMGGGQALAGAHFFSADASVNSNGALVVSFDEAGVGNATVLESLTGQGAAVYACINHGGKNPSASNKTNVTGAVRADGTFPATKNGRVRGTLEAGPPDEGNFSCPSGQDLVVACVRYSDVLLTDLTNGVSIVPTGTFSRSFVTIPGSCPN
jgi:hypothetical protein